MGAFILTQSLSKKNWMGFIVFLVFVLQTVFVFGQTGINANVIVQQPFSPYLDDLLDETPIISLTNPSTSPTTIAFRVELTNGQKFVKTKLNHYSDPVTLAPGQTRVLNNINFNFGSVLEEDIIDHNITEEEVESFIMTRMLPEGSYSYCIYAYWVSQSGAYVPISINGMPAEMGLCSYFPILYAQAPIVLNPIDRSEVNHKVPIVFNWLQPTPVSSLKNIRYNLYIVKTSGINDPETDMLNAYYYESNYFVKISDIKSTTFTFVPQTQSYQLEYGEQYAVMVQAVDTKGKNFFQNNGRSPVITFVYGLPYSYEGDGLVGEDDDLPAGDGLIVPNGNNFNYNINNNFNFGNVLPSSVNGTLVYRYKDATSGIAGGFGNGFQQDGLFYNIDPTPSANSKPLAQKQISLVVTYLFSGTFNGKTVKEMHMSKDNLFVSNTTIFPNADKVLATTQTGMDGSFNFTFGNTDSDFGLVNENFVYNMGGLGNFNGKLYKVLRIRVEDYYYCSPTINVATQSAAGSNLGTVVSFVKSYSLKVKVTNNVTNEPIPNVELELLRVDDIQNYPELEGEDSYPGFESRVLGKKTTNNKGEIVFKHLTMHSPLNNSDRYHLVYQSKSNSSGESYHDQNSIYRVAGFDEPFPYILPLTGSSGNVVSSNIIWNTDLDVEEYSMPFTLNLTTASIAGKVLVAGSVDAKPLGNVRVLLKEYNNGRAVNTRETYTDQNGNYEFTGLLPIRDKDKNIVGPERQLIVSVPGFQYRTYPEGQKIPPLTLGQRLSNQDIHMTPSGKLIAHVVDETGKPVEADIDVEGYSRSTTTLKRIGYYQFQQVEMLAPAGQRTVTITPTNRTFGQKDTVVNIVENPSSPIQFVVFKSQKRIKFKIAAKSNISIGASSSPVVGATASIRIGGETITQTSDSQGYVTFVFESSQSNFEFSIKGPEGKNYQDMTFQISNVQNTSHVVDYGVAYIKPGVSITGVVTFGPSKTPKQGAIVYVETGNGQRIETYTNSKGEYTLTGVGTTPINRKVWASLPGQTPVVISQSKTVNTLTNPKANFHLESSEIVLKDIYGFDFEATKIQNISSNKWSISGKLVQLEGKVLPPQFTDRNFQLLNRQQTIPFSNFMVEHVQVSGVSMYRPVENEMVTDLPELKLILNNTFDVIQSPSEGNYLKITSDNKRNGRVVGVVSLQKSSFQFSEEQLNIIGNGDNAFVLSESVGSDVTTIPTITSGTKYKKKLGVRGVETSYLTLALNGFNATASSMGSSIENDVITLRTTVKITGLAGVSQSSIQIELDGLKVKTTGIQPYEADKKVRFNLDNWQFEGNSISLSPNSSKINIPDGVIKTESINIPVSNVEFLPNSFNIGDYDLNSLSFGGIIPIEVVGNNTMFGYVEDGTVGGKGYYELRITGDAGQPGVKLSNLPGMNSSQSIGFQSLALKSNGEQVINPGEIQNTFKMYDVLTVNPMSFTTGNNSVILNGELDFGIPQLQTMSAKIKYTKVGGELKAQMDDFTLNFEGVGEVKFITKPRENPAQQLSEGEFWVEGYLQKEGYFELKAKLTKKGAKNVKVEILPNQSIYTDSRKKSGIKNVVGSMKVNANGKKWLPLELKGEMFGYEGIEEGNEIEYEVKGSMNSKGKQKLKVKNILPKFEDIPMSFDLLNARMLGNFNMNHSFAGLKVSGQMDFVADDKGWYFIGNGNMKIPGLSDIRSGFVIGDYKQFTTSMKNTVMQHAYDKNIPPTFRSGFSGFFFTGGMDLPFYVPRIGIDLGIASFRIGAESGLDARVWMNFKDNSSSFGIGAMAFARAYMGGGIDLLVVSGSVYGEVKAELGVKGEYITSPPSFNLDGCGSISLKGSFTGCYRKYVIAGKTCKTWGPKTIGMNLRLGISSNGSTRFSIGQGECSGGSTLEEGW